MRVEVEIDDKLYQAIMEKEVKIGFASSFTDIFVYAIHNGNVRKTGRWIKDDGNGFLCSVCNNGYKNQPTCMGKPMFMFCPCCGANMEGSEEDAKKL